MTPQEILETALDKSKKIKLTRIDDGIKKDIDVLILNINKNKSIVSAIVTSLVKKVVDPNQDIRLHRTDFSDGYSARTLDTNYTAPFFKKYFPRYANKESAFLTLATREKIAWTLKDGGNLKIRNNELKNAFLSLLNNIQVRNKDPFISLQYLLYQLRKLSEQDYKVFDLTIQNIGKIGVLNINQIIQMLGEHFSLKYSSRLPVIAIYTIYQELFKSINRYKDKILIPLNVHTSSDKHSFGDIEIYTNDKKPFEIIEIKHNIQIDRFLIFDILNKAQEYSINRYYLLTTHPINFVSSVEEKFISETILKIKKEYNLEIIANGIINSLKYYLRFIDDYQSFLNNYVKNLIDDSKNSTEVSIYHIEQWNNILESKQLDK